VIKHKDGSDWIIIAYSKSIDPAQDPLFEVNMNNHYATSPGSFIFRFVPSAHITDSIVQVAAKIGKTIIDYYEEPNETLD
jgi:hypothetical protein